MMKGSQSSLQSFYTIMYYYDLIFENRDKTFYSKYDSKQSSL